MKTSVLSAVALVVLAAGSAIASPIINSAVLNTRVFNDNSSSTLATVNNYPTLVQFDDSNLVQGFANRHNFRLSSNGTSGANFANADDFAIFSDVTLSGPGNGEGGLNVSPWFSQNVDGV
ncbi:MAG: hypothetical protein K2X32_06285, partial [Phycisphaerales bacterium]|nr:hypothetical protein [Phycisphaerales bacterium]